MARIDIPLLVSQATEFADRTDYVRRDPAVVKAAKVARDDIAQAGRSTSTLVREARSAWLRSADHGR